MKISIRVLPPSQGFANARSSGAQPPQSFSFAVPVNPTVRFEDLWKKAEQRYRENYDDGRKGEYEFRRLQDVDGNDIDIRDTIAEIFEGETDPSRLVVQVTLGHVSRASSIPYGSNLRPLAAQKQQQQHSREQIEAREKRQEQEERYGSAIEDLDPDQPIRSSERELAPPAPGSPHQIDNDGFLKPKMINRQSLKPQPDTLPQVQPQTSQQVQPQSNVSQQVLVQGSQETEGESLQGSPAARSPSVQIIEKPEVKGRLTIAAAPKPASRMLLPELQPKTSTQKDNPASYMDVDPIVDDDYTMDDLDMIPRDAPNRTPKATKNAQRKSPGDAMKSRAQTVTVADTVRMAARRWTNDEVQTLVTALAKDMTPEHIHTTLLPNRTVKGIDHKVAELKKTRNYSIEAKKASFTPLPRKAPSARDWNMVDINNLEIATRNHLKAPDIRQKYFPHRSLEEVMKKRSEVIQKWTEREQEEEENAYRQQRLKEQQAAGIVSSSPEQPWTQMEEDYLLAARLEGAEMSRVAKDHFPLRTFEQVKRRANNLYQNATRVARKKSSEVQGPDEPPSSSISSASIVAAMTSPLRHRIESKTKQVRSDTSKFNFDRTNELQEQAHKEEAETQRRQKMDASRAKIDQTIVHGKRMEDLQAKKEDEERRRNAQDLQSQRKHMDEFVAWEKEKEVNDKHGRPTRPPPERPTPSDIGTEIVTSQDSTVAFQTQLTPTELRKPPVATSTRKRKSSPEVVIVPSKKAKLATPTKKPAQGSTISPLQQYLGVTNSPRRQKPSPLKTPAAASVSGPSNTIRKGLANRSPKARVVSGVVVSRAESSSPIPEKQRSATFAGPSVANKKVTRQSKIAFPRDKGKRKADSPAYTRPPPPPPQPARQEARPTRTVKGMLTPKTAGTVIDISSDSSSYGDADIDDEALSAAVERSSQTLPSSSIPRNGANESAAGAPKSQPALTQPAHHNQQRVQIVTATATQVEPSKTAATSKVHRVDGAEPSTMVPSPAVIADSPGRRYTKEAEAQLLREYRGAMDIESEADDEVGSTASSMFPRGPSKAALELDRIGAEREERSRAGQRKRAASYLERCRLEEEQRVLEETARHGANLKQKRALYAEAEAWDDEPLPTSGRVQEVFGDDESADEEIVRADGLLNMYESGDNQKRGQNSFLGLREQGRIGEQHENEDGPNEPDSSPPEVPRGMRFTQDSVQTADLAPPFPSSGKVRSDYTDSPPTSLVSPNDKPAKASSATSVSHHSQGIHVSPQTVRFAAINAAEGSPRARFRRARTPYARPVQSETEEDEAPKFASSNRIPATIEVSSVTRSSSKGRLPTHGLRHEMKAQPLINQPVAILGRSEEVVNSSSFGNNEPKEEVELGVDGGEKKLKVKKRARDGQETTEKKKIKVRKSKEGRDSVDDVLRSLMVKNNGF